MIWRVFPRNFPKFCAKLSMQSLRKPKHYSKHGLYLQSLRRSMLNPPRRWRTNCHRQRSPSELIQRLSPANRSQALEASLSSVTAVSSAASMEAAGKRKLDSNDSTRPFKRKGNEVPPRRKKEQEASLVFSNTEIETTSRLGDQILDSTPPRGQTPLGEDYSSIPPTVGATDEAFGSLIISHLPESVTNSAGGPRYEGGLR